MTSPTGNDALDEILLSHDFRYLDGKPNLIGLGRAKAAIERYALSVVKVELERLIERHSYDKALSGAVSFHAVDADDINDRIAELDARLA